MLTSERTCSIFHDLLNELVYTRGVNSAVFSKNFNSENPQDITTGRETTFCRENKSVNYVLMLIIVHAVARLLLTKKGILAFCPQ
jgi:hypothetical protein